MKRCGPNPATAEEVRAHGPYVCGDTEVARCRVCCALSRQMIDGIRGMLGMAPLYEADEPRGEFAERGPDTTYPEPWARPMDGRRRVA